MKTEQKDPIRRAPPLPDRRDRPIHDLDGTDIASPATRERLARWGAR